MLAKSILACLSLGLTAVAGPIVIQIDATVSGCSQCSGVAQVTPGTFLTNIYSPVQVTLGPDTYSVANAATTGQFSAWNFQGPSPGNWVWSFVAAIDNGTNTAGTVILDDYIAGQYATQAAAAGATGIQTFDNTTVLPGTSTAGFVDSFTLSSTKTVDFLVDDFILSDNAGGVALTITANTNAVPETGSVGLTLAGLVGLAIAGRKRRARCLR